MASLVSPVMPPPSIISSSSPSLVSPLMPPPSLILSSPPLLLPSPSSSSSSPSLESPLMSPSSLISSPPPLLLSSSPFSGSPLMPPPYMISSSPSPSLELLLNEDSSTTAITTIAENPSPNLRMSISLQPANDKSKRDSKSNKVFRRFRSVFRTFPIIMPSCKMPTVNGFHNNDVHIHGGIKITGTLFGHRKARVNLAFQENSNCQPFLVLELAIPMGKLLQDMGMGLNRIALECEKNPNEKIKVVDEPIWTLFCNGKKMGYGVRREATDDDLNVMQLLHAVSVGVGVLPDEMTDPHDGEFSYIRAQFERVIGSKDSESYYMMMPDGNNNEPELSVFFVRV